MNDAGGTSIHARLIGHVDGEEREWTLSVEDADEPLRRGTVGAWGSFVKAAWDDLHVREIPGLSSGITGDADGDGVCDVDFDSGACGSTRFRWVKRKSPSTSGPHENPG